MHGVAAQVDVCDSPWHNPEVMQGNCTASRPVNSYASYARQLQQQQVPESDVSENSYDMRPDLLESIANMVAKPSEELNTPCVLWLDAGLLVAHSQLWLDGLHLDVRTAGAAVRPVIETSPAQPQRPQPPPALWMTDVTVVGNIQTLGGEQGSVTGVYTAGTTVLLESATPGLHTITSFGCVSLGDGASLRRHAYAPAPGWYNCSVGTCPLRKHRILLLAHV